MAQQIAVISFEGVLQSEATGAPISAGIALYHALCDQMTVAVSIVVSNEHSHPKAVDWMGKAGIYDHQYLQASIVGAPRAIQLGDLRGRGHSVALWVDANPETVIDLTNQGVPSLLFCHPTYTRPEHRPDHVGGISPWDTLVKQTEYLHEIRAADRRIVD